MGILWKIILRIEDYGQVSTAKGAGKWANDSLDFIIRKSQYLFWWWKRFQRNFQRSYFYSQTYIKQKIISGIMFFSFDISNFCYFHCVSPRLSENNEIYTFDTIRLIYDFVIDSCNDLRVNFSNLFQSSAPSLIILFFTEFVRLSEHVQFVKFWLICKVNFPVISKLNLFNFVLKSNWKSFGVHSKGGLSKSEGGRVSTVMISLI